MMAARGCGPWPAVQAPEGRVPAALRALAERLPAPVQAWACRVREDDADVRRLTPDEAAAIAGAVPHRQREFAAGRRCAHAALQALQARVVPAALGLRATSLPVGADRAPQWPSGHVGSLTHQAGVVLAALAPTAHLHGLGLDLERVDRMTPEVLGLIAVPQERERFGLWGPAGAAGAAAQQAAARLFALKEALYKALQPSEGGWLGFEDAQVLALPADPAEGSAAVGAHGANAVLQLLRPYGRWPAGQRFDALSLCAQGWTSAAVLVPALASAHASSAD